MNINDLGAQFGMGGAARAQLEFMAEVERRIIEIRAVTGLNREDADLLQALFLEEGIWEGNQSVSSKSELILSHLDRVYQLACAGNFEIVYTLIERYKATLHQQTGDETSLVPYLPRKRFAVGDGVTRFTNPGERPLTGEEKYQKPLHEAVMDLRDAIDNLSIAVVNALEPLGKAMEKLAAEMMKNPDFCVFAESLEKGYSPAEAAKSSARARSKADVKAKRRAMMKRRGRK